MKSLTGLTLICIGLLCIMVPGLVNAAPSRSTFVRLVNASQDAPPISLYTNGKQLVNNISFSAVTNYMQVPAGETHIQVAPVGVDAIKATAVVATLRADGFYTIAVIGEPVEMTATIIADDLSAPAADKARVRVYHFSPDSPAIDVLKIAVPKIDPLKDGDKIVYGLPFPTASNYVDINAGSYDLQARPATVADPVLANRSNITLGAGSIYSIFTIGALSPTSNIAIKVEPTSPQIIPAQLPNSSGATLPLAFIASLAGMLLASGLALRQRMCRQ